MNPPCPPFECAHMWGPSLVASLRDSSLHGSLRQPAFDLIHTIIVSDAAALISLKLNCHAPPIIDLSISSDFNDDEDELPFSHDVEEKENSCWSDFSVQGKLSSRDCKEWMCIPMLWFDVLIEMDPSVLPMSFSKAVFWALSRFSMVESETTMEMSLSVKDWLSSHAGKISTTLGWNVPKGSDDGADGNESRNAINASTLYIPLIRTFKRCAAHFVTQMEQGELRKQWTWEPRMAESLILLLVDPNDNVRHVDRLILEHVSKTRGLASGLQFLCSSAASLSAIYLGLRYALKLVLLDSVLSNFHNLHHLFFVVRKLLKEVGASPQKTPGNPIYDSNPLMFSSEGGFLRQPLFDLSPVSLPGCSSNFVDVKLWDKFCRLLSGVVWPSSLKCLVEGKGFIGDLTSQMTCVRLLEMLPVILEKLISSPSKLSDSSETMVSNVFDLKWLHDLMDWGKSSLVVISRHWKQCVISLLKLLKGVCHGDSAFVIGAIEMVISCDTVVIDDMKDQVSRLSVALSREIVSTVDRKTLKAKPSYSESLSFERKYTKPSSSGDANACELDSGMLPKRRAGDEVIVLSDDEAEKLDLVILSGMADRKKPASISSSKKFLGAFEAKEVAGTVGPPSQKRDHDASGNNPVSVEVLDAKKPEMNNACNINDSSSSLNNADSANEKSVHPTVFPKSLDRTCSIRTSNTNVDLETIDTVRKELARDVEDDPWERALKLAGRPRPLLTKPSVSVPKRKVIQLEMPMENKSGNLQRMDDDVKRFKPPKLDDWYRHILEIDYFSIVGLSSADNDEDTSATNFKEVPMCFQSPDHYVEIFRPLILEEFKAQLRSSYLEVSSTEEMYCGSLSVLSVERVDDFHLVRCIPDARESNASRGYSENDLVLLTKLPLQNSAQNVHMVGKVERREKDNKHRSSILVIRFYFANVSSHLNKSARLLMERSKWYVSRIMSITPQLREFQALSSLKDIPMLPTILNPVHRPHSYPEPKNVDLGKLSQPLQRMLKSSFNDSQLQAISVAIGTDDSKRSFELSLIQGPPGTGKTRTIVAIVSGLLALGTSQNNNVSTKQTSASRPISAPCTNPRPQISQSAAIARAWQDASLARQLFKEEENNFPGVVENSSRRRILICAQSNAAVDELVSRISSDGLYGNDGHMYKPYLVRIGNAKTVHPNSLPVFIDTLIEQRLAEEKMNENDPKNDMSVDNSVTLRLKLEKAVDSIRFYEAKRASVRDGNLETKGSTEEDDRPEVSESDIEAKLKILYGQKKAICVDLAAVQAREKKSSEEIRALKHRLRKSILREAEIVVTTLSGSGGDIYGVCAESVSKYRFGNSPAHSLFDAVVIDEAAQALEPATLIPLQLLKSSGTKCIMVGDPKQLPATVLSSVASKFLYQCSMFERLQRAGHPVIMLVEQYRMHPEICRFPSLHFYDNKLLNGNQMASKSAPFHKDLFLGPYVFFDIIDGLEHHRRNAGAFSLYNESEADAAVEVVRFFKKRYPSEFSGGRMGIITPYKSQLSLLRSRFTTAFGPSATVDIEFNTVDGFQGREVDILVLSTVRASDPSDISSGINSSSIGFVADVRRMNVALTRARLSLWIVGNARTLETNFNWAALLKNAKERNLVISVDRPYDSMFRKHFSASRTDKKVDNSRQGVEQTRISSKETHERKSRHVDSEANKGTGGHASRGVSRKGHKASKDLKSITDGKRVPDCKGDEKVIDGELDELAGTVDTGKKKAITEKLGGKTNYAKVRPEEDAGCRALMPAVSEGGPESSKHGAFGDSSQRNSAVSHSYTEDSQNKREENIGDKVSTIAETPNNLIASRKRQRDAVNALLSSALISSKKPEIPSKSASAKKPSPTSTAAEVVIKAPKTTKAKQTSSAGHVQERPTGSSHPRIHHVQKMRRSSSSSSDLNEEWKSFKDMVRDWKGS
ncbi:P-loop containing nucleoside triphosphate hydrolases superfamily protein isoform X2 [Tasmannia lanceolata]